MSLPLAATTERLPEIFLPWDQLRYEHLESLSWGVVLVFLGIVTGLVLYKHLREALRRRARIAAERAEMAAAFRRADLTEFERESVVQCISKAHLLDPEKTVTSESYFDAFLVPRLQKKMTEADIERIREKLFAMRQVEEELPASEGTRSLAPGQAVQLRFGGRDGLHAGLVAAADGDSLLIALAGAIPDVLPEAGSEVEGLVETEDALRTFATQVLEAVEAGTFPLLRLAHAEMAVRLARRRHMRVPTDRTLRFAHIHIDERVRVSGDLRALAQQGHFHPEEARLWNIGLEGCALAVSGPVRHYAPGDLILFRLPAIGGAAPVAVVARLVAVGKRPENDVLLHARFLHSDARLRRAVTHTIEEAKRALSAGEAPEA